METKAKPTLRNDRERRTYAEDPANWEDVEESRLQSAGGHPLFRLQRLKGTAILRVVAWKGAWHCAWEPALHEPARYEAVDCFELDENGCYDDGRSRMRVSRVVQRLKELGI